MANVNPLKTLEDLAAAGLPAIGCDSNGNAQYSRALTPAEITSAAAIIAAELPTDVGSQQKAINAAIAAAVASINGVDVTTLNLAQCRTLLVLLAANQGWIKPSGNAYVVNVHS